MALAVAVAVAVAVAAAVAAVVAEAQVYRISIEPWFTGFATGPGLPNRQLREGAGLLGRRWFIGQGPGLAKAPGWKRAPVYQK